MKNLSNWKGSSTGLLGSYRTVSLDYPPRSDFAYYNSLYLQYARSAIKPALVADKYTIKACPEDARKIDHDYIGPPDKESNLRPVFRRIAPRETEPSQRLRELQDEVQNWNQNFWAKHNHRFYEERKAFVKANKKGEEQQTLSADEMSVFYKEFLDKNWRLHFYYNLSWYIKNWTMLFLALRVELETVFGKKPKD